MHIGEFYPTVNHVYIYIQKNKGAFKKINPHAEPYLQEVAWLARQWVQKTGWVMPPKHKKVIINFWFWFRNGNRPDCANCEKVLVDALQGIVFENDKMCLPRMMDFDFDSGHPRLELEFQIMEGDNQ